MKHQTDALIIGFGKAGKTLAPFLAQQGLKVIVVERSAHMYGGTCINVGCIPTKALAQQAHLAAQQGIRDRAVRQELYAQAIREKDELVSLLRNKNLRLVQDQPGVTVITGIASFETAHLVRVETELGSLLVEADRIFINTGAVPVIPAIPGIESSKVYTSAEILDLAKLPERLAIIGGGYIGFEFASIFAGFGTQVTIFEQGELFLPREDQDIAAEVQKVLEHKGIRIQLQTGVTQMEDHEETGLILHLSSSNRSEEWKGDAALIATGRKANTDELNLEAAGINKTARGFIQVDEKLQTNQPHIWALGDVNGGPQFTYISLDDYRIVKDQWFGSGHRTTLDRKFVPYSVFIDPPLSHVGLTESEALKQGYHVKVAQLPVTASTRARQLKQTEGLLKAVIDAETKQLLGFTMFGVESSEVVNIVSVFIRSGEPYTVLRDTIFTHPSMAELLNDLLSLILD
ncbi:FAD-dependent oxidoreductase [Paenibacillus whitsoniae]|uniref:Pyridine nucleotide-disulfide oxidoreductase n=1 Tax=Paenibacillus whitsoniae TaxID=2496558 RepID=A0A3S0ASJ0_9BACL|nr:FAD-dependent oxidoreductase [Paenibacillus whitsoniae]RTE11592.1 pyridine nucleotide-disulfide oxidoreductase [Paenibacillus whitsoniae]